MNKSVNYSTLEYNYSIIIPHHNIPDLLKRCLLSIPKRDDTQVIVVDDLSNEAAISKLKSIENKYSYVEFVYLPVNGGGGKARNEGLKLAKGKWVLFADADDFFNYCLNQVLDEYKDKDFDAVYFDANSVDTDTYRTTYRCQHLNRIIKMSNKNLQKGIFKLRYRFGEPWCKMIKRDVIVNNNISFSETIIHNDTKYSYLVGYYSSKIHVDNRALYCVTDRAGSVSKRQSLERLFIRTQVFAEATAFFCTHGIHMRGRLLYEPLEDFLLKLDLKNSRQCISIMKSCGLTNGQITKGFICHLLKKSMTLPYRILFKIATLIIS